MEPSRTPGRKRYPKSRHNTVEVVPNSGVDKRVELEQARRKKIQNRISQQCLREKQVAQSQPVTLFQDLLNESHGKVTIDSRLIDEGLRLMRENWDMKEALLRMRKKMLSLSNSAAAVADDQIFDVILNTDRSAHGPHNDTTPTPTPTPHEEHEPDVPTSSVPQTPSRDIYSVEEQCGEVIESGNRIQRASTGSTMVSTARFQGPQMLDAYSPTWAVPFASQQVDDCAAQLGRLGEELHILPPKVFGPCIEKACVMYICRMLDVDVHKHQFDVNPSMATIKQKYSDRVADEVVADLAEIAVSLMGAFSGMSEYVYAVGANEVMEYVLRWRISPTLANRLNIPEPFRPTPLQYSRTGYSSSIDMINWPMLRDQLILYSNVSNIDEIVNDVVLNTVIDIPQMQISLNVLDLFLNRVLPKLNTEDSAMLIPHSWPPDIQFSPMEGLTEYTLRMIDAKMGEGARLLQQDDSLVSGPRKLREPKVHKLQLSSHYGLDRLPEWKLSMDFCQKYPFLDCSSFAASLPMIACESLLG